ncbi:MAG: hypothetical protein E7231_04045 [Cellulosilyticum sp.]|nr:hypothetical protein [Cellulosilyticum sp.]
MDKDQIYLVAMIFMIVSMINHLSPVSLVFWVIGIATTVTVINKKGEGVNIMDNKKRRIILGIGITLTICSLIEEISIVALCMFAIGFILTIEMVEKKGSQSE